MPRIRMPDGSVLDAPYGLDKAQLRDWVTQELARREESKRPVSDERFEQLREEGMQRGAAAAAGPIMSILGGQAALGVAGPAAAASGLRGVATAGRVLTHPVTVGGGTAGLALASGRSLPESAGAGLFAYLSGRGLRLERAGRRFSDAMRRSAERFGGTPATAPTAQPAVPIDVPGRTLTKPSAPPFLPKGKMRLDLGPTEQTTMTGTVGTSRPPTPKPVFSSTGATPRGRVSQPNVTVRAGTMDPAKQGPATAPGKVTPRNTPAGEKPPLESKLETSLGRGQEFEDVSERVKTMVRDSDMSKAEITKAIAAEIGATPGQARTLVDAIFSRSGLTRR